MQVIAKELAPASRYQDPVFRCKLTDGTFYKVNRSEIILDDEERLIVELSLILRVQRNPGKNARYPIIVKALLEQRAPFGKRLQQLLEDRANTKQLQFDIPMYK